MRWKNCGPRCKRRHRRYEEGTLRRVPGVPPVPALRVEGNQEVDAIFADRRTSRRGRRWGFRWARAGEQLIETLVRSARESIHGEWVGGLNLNVAAELFPSEYVCVVVSTCNAEIPWPEAVRGIE